MSIPLGRMASGESGFPYVSIARDVLVQLDHQVWVDSTTNFRAPEFHVVGATNDPGFFSPLMAQPWPVGQEIATAQGPSDGFVASFVDYAIGYPGYFGVGVFPLGGGFVGGPGHDGLTGVNSWNEHQDHFEVCGYSIEEGDTDILVASMFLNHSCEYVLNGTQMEMRPGADPMIQVRKAVLGGGYEDRPTVVGWANATEQSGPLAQGHLPMSGGMPFVTGLEAGGIGSDSVGNPAGGGIAVDATGRVSVVGRTRSVFVSPGNPLYPVTVAPYVAGRNAIQGLAGFSQDAVRTTLDMLPIGVSRTDGTGSRFELTTPAPDDHKPAPLPAPGFTGGTTPGCALEPFPFGRRVGGGASLLPRVLVDFDGTNALNEMVSFVFTRPPSTGWILGTVLQFGFPGVDLPAGPTPLLQDEAELWLLDSPVTFLNPAPAAWFGFNDPNSWWIQGYQSWRFSLPLIGGPLAVQLLTLAACDSTWPANCGCDGGLVIVASPALTVEL